MKENSIDEEKFTGEENIADRPLTNGERRIDDEQFTDGEENIRDEKSFSIFFNTFKQFVFLYKFGGLIFIVPIF